jgi:hypothetical protein
MSAAIGRLTRFLTNPSCNGGLVSIWNCGSWPSGNAYANASRRASYSPRHHFQSFQWKWRVCRVEDVWNNMNRWIQCVWWWWFIDRQGGCHTLLYPSSDPFWPCRIVKSVETICEADVVTSRRCFRWRTEEVNVKRGNFLRRHRVWFSWFFCRAYGRA